MDSQSYDFGDLKICPAKFVFGILLEFRVQRYDLAGICEYEHRGRKQNDLMIFLQETLVCYIGFKEKKTVYVISIRLKNMKWSIVGYIIF